MLLSAAATEDKEKTEPVVYVLVRSRPYFVRVRRRDITVAEDSAVVQLRAPGIAFSEADVVPDAAFAERALWRIVEARERVRLAQFACLVRSADGDAPTLSASPPGSSAT